MTSAKNPLDLFLFEHGVLHANQNTRGGGGSPASRFSASEVVVGIGEMVVDHQGVYTHPWDRSTHPEAALGVATTTAAA